MIASIDVENQIVLIRHALTGLPDLASKLDDFIEKISHKMCARPREAADNLLVWLRNLQIDNHTNNATTEEIRKFLLLLKQAVFVNNLTNTYFESFDTFYSVTILPMLSSGKHSEAAVEAWSEFLSIFEAACRHEQLERHPETLLHLDTQQGFSGPTRIR